MNLQLGKTGLDEQSQGGADTGKPDRGPEAGQLAVAAEEDVHPVVDDAADDVSDGQRVQGLVAQAGAVAGDDGRREQGETLETVGAGGLGTEDTGDGLHKPRFSQ